MIHHSDRGVQYVSTRYTKRLKAAGIEPSWASVGDSYDNALAETINVLCKADLIHNRGPWRNLQVVEMATLDGSTGTTTVVCSDRSATSRQLNPKRLTIDNMLGLSR